MANEPAGRHRAAVHLPCGKLNRRRENTEPQLYVQAPFLPTLQHTLTGKNEA